MNQLSRAIRSAAADHPFVGAVLVAGAWLLLMRGLMLLHSGVWPHPGWMLLADASGALVLALLLSVLRGHWVRLSVVLLLGVAFYGAGAHMAAHGTIFRVAHLGKLLDPVLVGASVASPWLLLLPVYCLLAYLLHWLHQRINPGPAPRPVPRLGAAIACIAVYGLAVTSLTYPSNNVVISVLAQIPGSVAGLGGPPERDELEPLDPDIRSLFFHREVRGGRVENQPNVLLVVIEGLSAGYLPTVAEYHGLSPAVRLPAMERELERRGFRIYRNALSMQRQTDRGTYPVLCGSYPRLGSATPEMADVAAGKADPVCVPEIMANAGYRTGYLQAAPLEYMEKDRFMPKAGFEQVDGAGYFGAPEGNEGWGPSDEEFFPAAVDWIQDLADGGGPWLAVTLNAGTHHPFAPGAGSGDKAVEKTSGDETEKAPISRQKDRQSAFSVMAGELSGFLDRLAARGLLENTLVILTSDEAGGFLRGEEGPRVLDGNFGALAVRPPGGGTLDGFVGQSVPVATIDIALTVLDAAGIADDSRAARGMIGRSLLVRERQGTRGLLLGDAYAGYTIFLQEDGAMIACGEALVRCTTWRFSPRRLFGSLTEDTGADPFLEFRTRRQLVERAAIIQ